MADLTDICVAVINFKSEAETVRCLASVRQIYQGRLTVFLHDNSGYKNQNLANLVSSTGLKSQYFWSKNNIGFAKAANELANAAYHAGFEYVFLLNNDTEIIQDDLTTSLIAFEHNKKIAVAGMINYFQADSKKIWQSGKNVGPFGVGFLEAASQPGSYTCVDYIPGSAFLVRTSLFIEVGGFDESYFAYYEEADFCARVKKLGLEVVYINRSRVLHSVGASSDSYVKTYLKTRNKLYYRRKNMKKYRVGSMLLILKDILICAFVVRDSKVLVGLARGVRDYFKGKMGPGVLESTNSVNAPYCSK